MLYDATGTPLRGTQSCRRCAGAEPHVHVFQFACPACNGVWADPDDWPTQDKPMRLPTHRAYAPTKFGAVCQGSGSVVVPTFVAARMYDRGKTGG